MMNVNNVIDKDIEKVVKCLNTEELHNFSVTLHSGCYEEVKGLCRPKKGETWSYDYTNKVNCPSLLQYLKDNDFTQLSIKKSEGKFYITAVPFENARRYFTSFESDLLTCLKNLSELPQYNGGKA